MSKFGVSFVAAISLVLTTTVIVAQPVSVGVKGGVAVNDQHFEYGSQTFQLDVDRAIGLNFSLQIERKISPFVSVRIDAGWIQKGFKETINLVDESANPIGTKDAGARINYASFALLLKRALPSSTYFVAGPRVDIKLSVSDDELDLLPQVVEEGLKSTVFGLTVGVGQEFSVPALGALFVEVQYLRDLTDLYSRGPIAETKVGTLLSIDNQAITFLVGLRR